MNPAHLTVDQHLSFLHIRIKSTFNMPLRKADMVAKLRTSSTNFTFCHRYILQLSNLIDNKAGRMRCLANCQVMRQIKAPKAGA